MFLKWYKANENYKKYSPHSVYEEFKGVLTGAFTHAAYLTEEVYQALGIKQSIFSQHEKSEVYAIFIRYLNYLKDEKYYETNVLSFEYLEKVPQHYDYVIIDEVQDITAIQLYLILNSLKQSGLFLLCGDANQIVHPNFFSWAKVKSLFHQHQHLHDGLEITHILHHNYRNSKRVTEISNRVLLLKNARFGSIDKESHYLVESNADLQGGVYFLKNHPDILSELDQKTAISTQFAVIVMHEEQKRQAQRVFKTPLVFSIQEAKGLEYTNIILYNFVSNATTHFNDICQDIQIEDLQRDFKYARHKDKQDKSLEIYKFYINALYVGLTRAMQHLYWVEKEHDHRLFRLLGLQKAAEKLDLDEQQSSLKDWQKEAQRLELQGKKEQAQRIRSEILKEEQPDWQVMTGSMLKKIEHDALIEGHKKSKLQLFEYAVVYLHQRYLAELADSGFKPAQQIFDESLNLRDEKSKQTVLGKYYTDYQVKHPTALKKKIEKFGLNYKNEFDQTPLTAATWVGNTMLFRLLLDEGADQHCLDAFKRNLFQVALLNAVRSEKYASGFFHENEHLLPRDSIILQLEHKLFKLESQQAEYVIFNLMYLMQFIRGVQHFIAFDRHTCSGLLMQYVEYLPEKIWSTSRKKRSYLSGLLSRNEVESRDPYNKKIFKRIKRGEYILNPDLVMKVEGQWQPIYSVMGIDRMGEYPSVRNTISSTQQLESHQMLVEKRKQAIDTLARLFQ